MAQNGKADVQVHSPKPFDTLIRRMSALASLDDGSPVSTDRLDKMLTAQTVDEIWQSGEQDSANSRTLAGVELVVDNFEVKFSRGALAGGEKITTPFVTTDGRQMYLMVSATRISMSDKRPDIAIGERVEFNTSAPDVVLKLWRLRETDNLQWSASLRALSWAAGSRLASCAPCPSALPAPSIYHN